ncbi:MAG: hypothetical protein WAU54_15950 [Chania sp.]
MSKQITKQKAKKAQPKTPRQQFNHYCQEVKKQQLNIENLKKQQSVLLTRFQQEYLPIEKKYLQTSYLKIEKLLSFTPKKSLSHSQRDLLTDWINEEIDILLDNPFAEQTEIQQLKDKLLQTCAIPEHVELGDDELAQMRSLVGEEFEFVHTLSDAELSDLMRNPHKFQEKMQEELEQRSLDDDMRSSFDDEEDDFSFFDDDEDHSSILSGQQQKMESLFSASAANRMYKKLAMLFHPDREMDESAKQEKHDLMIQLAQAKKTQDIWTIISLYQQHVDADGDFAEKELPALNSLLSNRVEQLKIEYRRLNTHADSLEGLVWAKFGAKTQSAIEKKLMQHEEMLRGFIAEDEQQTRELTSLKVLKQHLTVRNQEQHFELLKSMEHLFRF